MFGAAAPDLDRRAAAVEGPVVVAVPGQHRVDVGLGQRGLDEVHQRMRVGLVEELGEFVICLQIGTAAGAVAQGVADQFFASRALDPKLALLGAKIVDEAANVLDRDDKAH